MGSNERGSKDGQWEQAAAKTLDGAGREQGIFFGALGLRAGWGIALFFLLAIMVGTALFFGLLQATGQLQSFQQKSRAAQIASSQHEQVTPAPMEPKQAFTAETAEAGAVLLAALAISFIERRRFRAYGLGLQRLRDLLPGAVWGLACIALLVGLLRSLHLLVFDRQLLHGAAALRYGAEWLVTFALVGIFEEFMFRGYIQFTLMRGLLGIAERLTPGKAERTAFWLATLVWSLLFSLMHLANAGEDPFGLVMVFVAGLLFSYALWRTGSLWWGIGFHLTWDWGQSFLFGVPDSGTLSADRLFATHAAGRLLWSGGGTGPEGSILVLLVLSLAGFAIKLHRAQPLPPVAPEGFPAPRPTEAITPIP